VGNLKGDGKLDLAYSRSLLLGNGDGTFQAGLAYTTSESCSVFPSCWGSVVAGDFNGDGRLDLAAENTDFPTVSLLLGNGDGTFPVALDLADDVGANPSSLAVEAFNKDGKPDLVVATAGCAPGLFPGCGPGGVSVLPGNGDGTLQTAVNYSAGLGSSSVAVGDFNGDGKLDLAVSNADSDNVSVLLGNGGGTFQRAVNYGAGSGPISVAVGDFNSDGKLDLAKLHMLAPRQFCFCRGALPGRSE